MHKRAELNGILVSLETLTPGKQQWLEIQAQPKTKEEKQQQKRVKRLIKLLKHEEEK